jgi:hypothetical protein
MATTAKELIEILQKYVKPDEVVIWQYYTREDFEQDEDAEVTNEEFGEIADSLGNWDVWEGVPDLLYDAIYDYKKKKGQK